MSKNVDSLQLPSTEMFDGSVVDSCNIQQKINNLLETIKQERLKFNSYCILIEIISDSIKNNSISENVKQKVEKVVFTARVNTCLEIKNLTAYESLSSQLLGVLEISPVELTSEERYELKNVVQQTLSKRFSDFTCNLEKANIPQYDSMDSHLKLSSYLNPSLPVKILFEEKLKLNKQQDLYYKNLIQYYKILEDFIKLRVNKFPSCCQGKVQEYNYLNKMYGLRAEVLNSKVNLGIFTETKSSLASYKGIIKELKEQQKKSKYEILKLRELKEQYLQVSNKQFNEILTSYKHYKASYEKIKILHEKLNLS